MSSTPIPADVAAKLDALNRAVTALCELDVNSLPIPVRLHMLQRLETTRWPQLAVSRGDVEGGSGQAPPSALRDLTTLRIEQPQGLPVPYTQPALTDIANVTSRGAVVTEVPLEQSVAERFTVDRKLTEPKDRERREAALQKAYARYLQSLGHRVIRKAITVPGELGTLYTDLYDATTDDLIEVKSSSDRNTIRLALGQILDYARYVKPRTCTILLPSPPAGDLIDLLNSLEVQAVWLTQDHRFEHSRIGSTERLSDEDEPG